MRVCTGIVLFNPDIERLIENLNHIINQTTEVLLVDNGSKNIDEIKKAVYDYDKITFLENGVNFGIAYALNCIVKYAQDKAYDWVLTLDQDSVANEKLIESYTSFLTDHKSNDIGCLTCNIVDRNFVSDRICNGFEEVEYCITSGSLINVEKVIEIGCFDESMFIDKVDCDLCINLRKHGYRIIKISYDGILHEIGHGIQINLGFRKWELYNHNSFRRYYMCRNASYLLIKYHDYYVLSMFFKEIFHFILVFLYEDKKIEKAAKGIKGFIDGFRMTSKYNVR